jgi:hypothetical protein
MPMDFLTAHETYLLSAARINKFCIMKRHLVVICREKSNFFPICLQNAQALLNGYSHAEDQSWGHQYRL